MSLQIFLVGLLTTVALVSQTAALPDKNDVDSKSPSVVSRLDPVLRKALLQALSNLERNSSEDESTDAEATTVTTISDELLEESTTSDQTAAVQYHSYVVDANNETGTTNDDTEIIQTIIVKAPPRPTVSSSLDVDEVSEQSDNDVIIKFDKLDPVKESDIRVETVQVARSVSPSDKANEINGDTDDDNFSEKSTTKQLKKVTTYKPTTTTTTTTTTEPPTHNEDGENIEHVKENDVKIYQAPLVTAFTIQQDGNGLPKNVIPLYKQDVVPASMSLPVEQFSFSSHTSNQNFQNVQSNRNTNSAPTFSIQTSHQPQPPVFNANTYSYLEQKQKQLEQQIVFLQDQQRKQEELFRQQQSYQDQQALQRQAQLLLEQRLRIEEDYRLRQQKYEQELKAYKEKQQVQIQSRFNQPSVVVEGQTTPNTADSAKKAPIEQTQSIEQQLDTTQQQFATPQHVPAQAQFPAQPAQQTTTQQQFPDHQHLPVQQPPQPFAPELSQQNVQVQPQTVTEVKSQQHLQVQPLQHREQDIELQRQIERQNEEYRIKTLKYEEDLKVYRQKIQAQQFAEQQSQQQQQQQQQLFSRQQLPFLPAQQFAPAQQIFSQALPQQQQQVRFNNNQPQFRTNVQIVPSVQFQSFQVPTQQMLPIREAQSFRPRSQSEFQQQTNIPQLSPVQELPQRSFQQFHTSGPVIQNSNIDPVIAAPPDAIQRNRVFRQESDTANFFNNNNRITLNPVNNNADNYLQSLLFQSGISGRQNEDLNIITKVLALNHGIQQSPLDQQQIRFPRRENV